MLRDFSLWSLLFYGLLSGTTCVSGTGCWAPNTPATEFSVNPVWRTFSFSNTKDVHVLVEGLEFDASAKAGKLAKLEVTDNASSVIERQIVQMERWNDQLKTNGDNLERLVNAIAAGAAPMVGGYFQTRQAIATDPGAAVKALEALGYLVRPPAATATESPAAGAGPTSRPFDDPPAQDPRYWLQISPGVYVPRTVQQ